MVVSSGYIGDFSRNNGDYKILLMVVEHAIMVNARNTPPRYSRRSQDKNVANLDDQHRPEPSPVYA